MGGDARLPRQSESVTVIALEVLAFICAALMNEWMDGREEPCLVFKEDNISKPADY